MPCYQMISTSIIRLVDDLMVFLEDHVLLSIDSHGLTTLKLDDHRHKKNAFCVQDFNFFIRIYLG